MVEGPEVVFLLGAPRSGTTWLQEMLAVHPRIASPQELKVYSEYLRPLGRAWDKQPLSQEDEWRRQRFTGLGCVLGEEEFYSILQELVIAVYRKVLALKPGSTVMLDKDPPNNFCTQMRMRLFPNAKVIHLIRDGREVAASLINANKGWGESWAPGNVAAAARTWKRHVEAAREAQASDRYLEVRYEDLREDPREVLKEVLINIGLECSDSLLGDMMLTVSPKGGHERSVLANSLVWDGEVTSRNYEVVEPEGFTGGVRGDWKAWNAFQRVQFEVSSGGLLTKLGYIDGNWTSGHGLLTAVALAREAVYWRAQRSYTRARDYMAR